MNLRLLPHNVINIKASGIPLHEKHIDDYQNNLKIFKLI